MNTILIQSAWGEYEKMLDLTYDRTSEYCDRHKISYIARTGKILDGFFDKPYLIKQHLDIFDLIVWMDADTFIARDVSLREVPIKQDEIGVCYYKTPVPHHNTGVVFVKPGERVNKFIDKWLAGYPIEDRWKDQRTFNDIADDCVVTIPDEWNSCHINPVDKPVIKSYHGDYGGMEQKLSVLKDGFERNRYDK